MSKQKYTLAQTEILKRLRDEHAESFSRTQALLKEQQKIRKNLKTVLKERAKTIPEIAYSAELPADLVLWHIVAMKKYDLVQEVGQDGDYYQYALPSKEEK